MNDLDAVEGSSPDSRAGTSPQGYLGKAFVLAVPVSSTEFSSNSEQINV